MTEFAIYLLFGDFGLLTLTPVFLITILLPSVVLFEFLSRILEKTGYASPLLLSFIMGLGCTTAALATVSVEDPKKSFIASTILCIIVPCSAQVAVIIPLLLLLEPPFAIFYLIILFAVSISLYRLLMIIEKNTPLVLILPPQKKVLPDLRFLYNAAKKSVKNGLISIKEACLPFMIGSIIISLLTWKGYFAKLCLFFYPFTVGFLHLPEEAGSLFILSIIKRDLGAALLLTIVQEGSFTQIQLTAALIILTLFVPCFASTVILIKKEGPFKALLIWCMSLIIAFSVGKLCIFILEFITSLSPH